MLIYIRNELQFLHITNLIVFMLYLSYIRFYNLKIIQNIFFFIFEGDLIFFPGVYVHTHTHTHTRMH